MKNARKVQENTSATYLEYNELTGPSITLNSLLPLKLCHQKCLNVHTKFIILMYMIVVSFKSVAFHKSLIDVVDILLDFILMDILINVLHLLFQL